MNPNADWDARAYHRVSDPQFSWGIRVLDRLALRGDERVADVGCGTGRLTRELRARVPRGWVVGVDRSATMLAQARASLHDIDLPLVHADAAALPFANAFDVIFSTATFHWVLDHEALFRSLLAALRPGGRLHAQCGGASNLARLRTRAAALIRRDPFAEHFQSGWHEPWLYAGTAETKARLRSVGFTAVGASLERAPVIFQTSEEFRGFAETVCLRPYLHRLPPALRPSFTDELVKAAAADDPRFELDYARLNLSAQKPERTS